MIKNVMNAAVTAARQLVSNGRLLLVFLSLYVALLFALYLLVSTREANVWQVLLTLVLAIIAPVLFFVLQAMGVCYTQSNTEASALLRRALHSFWKLMLVSVPLILLAWLLLYLLGKIPNVTDTESMQQVVRQRASDAVPAQSIQWRAAALSTFKFLLFFVALPLAAIHLWIAAARDGVARMKRSFGSLMAHAFAPQAVLVYAVGFVVFAVLPYFLIWTRTPVENAWIEMNLLGVRLALAFTLVCLGWIITVGTLAEMTNLPGAVSEDVRLSPPSSELERNSA